MRATFAKTYNNHTNTSLLKPSLILHVGPRKTGTTTIQGYLFQTNQGHSKSEMNKKKELMKTLEEDKFQMLSLKWSDGKHLIHFFNKLSIHKSYQTGESIYNRIDKELKNNLLTRRKNIAISNEAFSCLNPTVEAKKALEKLFDGYTVKVVMVYRPLMPFIKSLYQEQRRINVKKPDFEGLNHSTFGNEFGEDCQEELASYYAKIWDKPEFGDPLTTFNTFSFLFSKVEVLQLQLSNKIDILEQFACQALDAKNTCHLVKKYGPPERLNLGAGKKKFKLEEDLIVFEAQKRGLYASQSENKNCKRALRRKDHVLFLQQSLDKKNISVTFLQQKCINRKMLMKMKERALESERVLSSGQKFYDPLDNREFCSLEIASALRNPLILNIIQDPRICVKDKWKKLLFQ
ncbi:predicted protein [Chaetoceros tenuissimus]|jgi:TusA-related sulfurtransferase|uniref:Sulfotransferase n=1 Tax=Chaetoceros tenuissimus TaxID=426638 RepID=A0AAD3CSW5_9STRA|nr:predicted protein [Chaetoceros tenuissimus]